jgi:pilus assembly protein CpaF
MFSITIRERSGQVYTFHFDKSEVLIGRVKGNDVILPKQNISKRHTMIRVLGSRFTVEDMGSTNGTYVNGHRIGSAVEIGPEDKVYLGDFVMNFQDLGQVAASDAVLVDVPDMPEADVDIPPPRGGPEPVSPPPPVEPQPEPEPEPIYEDQLDLSDLDAAPQPPPVPLEDPPNLPETVDPDLVDDDEDSEGQRLTGPIDGLAHARETEARVKGHPAPPLQRWPGAHGPTPDALAPPARPAGRAGQVPAMADAPESYFDALATLYHNAQRDLRPELPADAAQMSDTDWAEMEDRVGVFIDQAVAVGEVLALPNLSDLKRDLIYELTGLGPLEPMLDDPTVETIEVNGPAQLFVFRQGRREAVGQRFSGQPALAAAVDRLVRATGQVRAHAATHAEGTLIDGTSVRVIWPPLCPQGPVVVLRKPRAEMPDLDSLVERGLLTSPAAALLVKLVRSGRSIAVCGRPHVGRRTLLHALAQHLDPTERIVVVEDGLRLRLPQAHVVRLDGTARHDSATGLLQLARRLGADRLVLGETATVGAVDLVMAAADGLPPWMATFHATSAEDFLTRAAHGVSLRHPGIPDSLAASRVAGTVDAVAVFSPESAGPDRVSQVHEVALDASGVLVAVPLLS